MSQQPLPKHEYQSEGCTAHPGGLFCGRDASDAIHASPYPTYPVHEGWCSGQHLVDLEGNGECISREALARWNTESAAPPAIPGHVLNAIHQAAAITKGRANENRDLGFTALADHQDGIAATLMALAGTSVPAAPTMPPLEVRIAMRRAAQAVLHVGGYNDAVSDHDTLTAYVDAVEATPND